MLKENKTWQFLLKQDKRIYISLFLWGLFTLGILLFVSLMWAFQNISWVEGNSFESSINNYPQLIYKNVKSSYGNITPYALTMTMGMLVAVGFSCYNFWRKGLDINHLSFGVIICIPSSLFMASFFGKLNTPEGNAGTFFDLFKFWEPGLAIHGGVIGAMATGVPLFLIISRRTKISTLVYADSIIPNILIGQAIGRWGNFFNHEVMGAPVKVLSNGKWDGDWNSISSSGLWLPKWITNNTTMIANGDGEINGVKYTDGTLIQMNPIFLYESFVLFAAWLLLLFVVPNITKWISKKPWNIDPNSFSYDKSFTFKQFFLPWIKSDGSRKSYRDVWNQAYYRSDNNQKETYLASLKETNKFKESLRISKANNLYDYTSTKAGVSSFAFFFFWNFVRFILELQRPDDHLFIMQNKPLSLTLIFLTMLVGLLGMVICQYILPMYLRRNGWLYEKEYFIVK